MLIQRRENGLPALYFVIPALPDTVYRFFGLVSGFGS